ncbi:hypothetical protein [Pseudohongiella sp. O18]|uniref:hypothetical protein n=1 Tax=Pseudohongiella sp. O18 TaxID=2904248 RepID=UPI001F369269|nr:hypothetical protein [Pseudohongiella sp. O18]
MSALTLDSPNTDLPATLAAEEVSSKTRKIKPKENHCEPSKLWLVAATNSPNAVNRIKRDLLLGKKPRKPIRIPDTKLPPYYQASHELRFVAAAESIRRDPSLIAVAITMNVAPSLDHSLREGSTIDYVRDQLRKEINKFLKGNQIYIQIAQEAVPGTGRIHYHGIIGIPRHVYSDQLRLDMQRSIAKCPLCRKYKSIGSNIAVKLRSHLTKGDKELGLPPLEMTYGWPLYCIKDADSNFTYATSRELKTKGKHFYEEMRAGQKIIRKV